jgi:DNA-directed RNA polymerase specialized sigma24 family protein
VWGERLSKLTDADREQVWLRADEGASHTELAKRFGVSISTISRVLSNRRQARNVHTVPNEISRSEQGEKQGQVETGQSRQDQAVPLAEGRKRKPGRSTAEATRH